MLVDKERVVFIVPHGVDVPNVSHADDAAVRWDLQNCNIFDLPIHLTVLQKYFGM